MRWAGLLSVALAVSLPPASVLGCVCSPPPPNVKSARDLAEWRTQRAGAIFEGKVEKTEVKWRGLDAPVGAILPADPTEAPPTALVTLSVSRNYRGVAERTVRVETGLGGGDCGFPFEIGKQYLVLAQKVGSGLVATNICSGTALLEDSQANLAYLRGDPVPESATSQAPGNTGQLCVRVVRDGTAKDDDDGVAVLAVGTASPLPVYEAESDGKGMCCAAHVRPGKYILLFAPDWPDSPATFAYYPGVMKASEATQIDVQAGQALSLVFRIPRQSTHSVRGRVAISNHSPLPDSKVGLISADQPFSGPMYAADVGEDGSFYMPKVLPGRYWGFVAVDDEGWSTKKVELVVDKDLDGVALVLIADSPN